jgi:hypothetical protein
MRIEVGFRTIASPASCNLKPHLWQAAAKWGLGMFGRL